MIQYQDLTLRRNGRVLFANASAMIHPGWKVALTGENGAGKSTFFAALLGGFTPDGGTLSRPQNWTVSHMAQEVAALSQSAIDFVLDGDKEWRAISNALGWFSPSALFTHHQKTIICDSPSITPTNNQERLIAFVGGLDLTKGRFDTPGHPLFATLKTWHKV